MRNLVVLLIVGCLGYVAYAALRDYFAAPARTPAPAPQAGSDAPEPGPARKTGANGGDAPTAESYSPLTPGRVSSADQALDAALQLHLEKYPGYSTDRFLSNVPPGAEEGTVSFYLDKDGERSSEKATYWVGRKAELWHAYDEIPMREDYDFVLVQIAQLYLDQELGGVKFFAKPRLMRDGERIRMQVKVQVDAKIRELILTFKKNGAMGWFVEKYEDEPDVKAKGKT
ncbi:MAG: hypothetical protein M5U26_06640 [Planctomycetota bacterium]|nr:hypothetical protein [Planctomycetota bacterium]